MADDDDDDQVIDSKDHAGLVRRIEKLVRQQSELKAKLAERDAKLADFEKSQADIAKSQRDAEKVLKERDALLAEKAGWAEERAIVGAKVTEQEGIDFIRLAWSRVPEEARPKGGLPEWLGEREKLPKGVQAYLPPPAQDNKQVAKPPAPNAGTRQPPAGGFTAEQLPGMSMQEYAQSREAIWSQLGFQAPPLPQKS